MDYSADYRWFSRFSDGSYFPDWALETEIDSDDFSGWSVVPETDVTWRLIAICEAQKLQQSQTAPEITSGAD